MRPGANDTLAATLDSIDQGAKDIPISTIAETTEAVTFEVGAIGSAFAGKFNADGSEIDGTCTQGGQSHPLVFKRMAEQQDVWICFGMESHARHARNPGSGRLNEISHQ